MSELQERIKALEEKYEALETDAEKRAFIAKYGQVLKAYYEHLEEKKNNESATN